MKTCEVCKWWLKTMGGNGHCQRHAPISRLLVTTDKHLVYYGLWPTTHESNSCGDFEAKDAE